MISYIKGTVEYVDSECVVVDNHGMGYQIKTPARTREVLKTGQEGMLYTYLYIREDILALYGFLTKEDLRVFQILLGVNGIGPKAALSVLSTMSVEDLYYAVLSEDSKSIAKTPGIGPKGARRLIVELKDKLHLEDLGIGEEDSGVSAVETDGGDYISDTIEALVALGYSSGEAYRAVYKVSGAEAMDSERLLKEALKVMLTL